MGQGMWSVGQVSVSSVPLDPCPLSRQKLRSCSEPWPIPAPCTRLPMRGT